MATIDPTSPSATMDANVDSPDDSPGLTGNLQVHDIIFMVIANSAPLTVIVAVYTIGFTIGNGIGFPSAYLIVSILLVIFSVGFTTMTRYIPNPGAFFTYIAHGLGRPLGLSAAYVALLCYFCLYLGVLAYFGYDLSLTIEKYTGVQIPWLLGSVLEWLVIAFLGYRNIDLSAKVLGVFLVIEIVIGLVISFVVLAQGGAHGIDGASFTPSAFLSGSPALAIMFAVASFLGFETTAIYRAEANDPARTIPRATYGAVIVVGTFYTFTSWAFIMAWGSDNVVHVANTDPSFLFSTAQNYIGTVGNVITHIFVITSIFAVSLAFHNVCARYLHALGNARALPAYLGRVGHHKAPSVASVATSIVGAVLVLVTLFTGLAPATTFAWFVGLGTLAYLILLMGCSFAVLIYFAKNARHRQSEPAWKVFLCPAIATIGLGIANYITIMNFPLLVGDVDASGNLVFSGLSAGLLALLAAVIVFGIIEAYAMRSLDRRAYDLISESGKNL